MTVRERIEAMCCGDLESADLVESLLKREHQPWGTDGSVSPLVLAPEQCPRCGWRLDADLYCEFCSEIATRPLADRGRSTAAAGTEEVTE